MASVATDQPNIHVHVDNSAGNRPYQIVATLLVCAAVGMTAYALSLNGWLDISATFLAIFTTQLVRLLFANGILALPEHRDSDFAQTAGFLKVAAMEFRTWQRKSPIWRLTALAVVYAIVFMILRWVMALALGVLTNIWIAGACAALFGALIIFPQLFTNASRSLSSKVKTKRVSE